MIYLKTFYTFYVIYSILLFLVVIFTEIHLTGVCNVQATDRGCRYGRDGA